MKIKHGLRTLGLSCLMLLTLGTSGASHGDTKTVIDAKVAEAISKLRQQSPAASSLIDKASAVLVFPDVIKIGFGIGGEYGEGALLIKGATVDYYSTAGASFGLQFGAQYKSEIILFMADYALEDFRQSEGWQAGVDGSVAIATIGVGGAIDSKTIQHPIVGFVFSNKGLMYNLTLEGKKITRIER